MLGIALTAFLVIGGGLLWSYFVRRERSRFAWAFWGWVVLAVANVAGLAYELALRL